MPEINSREALLIVFAWSIILGGLSFIGGYKAAAPDCGTCEAALDDAIDELHKCQQGNLTSVPNRCDSERQAERLKCQQALAQYKLLRCKICDSSHDTYPPQSDNSRDASDD